MVFRPFYFFVLCQGIAKQSKQFLEVTKTAVELVIEQDEEAAIDFIDKNCKKL